jgi:perosamine synthetase
MALGVGPGDEVIVPTLTFVATANAVTFCGARPVFVDCEPGTWNIDPALIEAKITPRTRGVIVVHLFGNPVDMDAVSSIARRHRLFVVEDAAQAHGAEYKGKRVGSLADVAAFSFYGNKILTTGEGGMVVTDDSAIASKIRLLKNHGMDPNRRYWHPVVGYNYRMTNIAAAIGLAQIERFESQAERRREVISWYAEHLDGISGITTQVTRDWAKHAWWMFSVVLDNESASMNRDEAMAYFNERGVETRPFVHPLHNLPPYRTLAEGETFPVAERIAANGINLPTSPGLLRQEVAHVCATLVGYLDGAQSR